MTQSAKDHLYIVPNKTRLCVDGFARSANSTLSWEILKLSKQLYYERNTFSHHTHSAAQIKIAVQHKIPTFVIIRDPVDAIASFQIYSGRKLEDCVKFWLGFYAQIKDAAAGFELVFFDDIIKDKTKVAASILEKAKIDYVVDRDHAALIDQKKKNSSQKDLNKHSMPVEGRIKEKSALLESTDRSIFQPSIDLYDWYKSIARV